MPRPAPVTITTRPSQSFDMTPVLFLLSGFESSWSHVIVRLSILFGAIQFGLPNQNNWDSLGCIRTPRHSTGAKPKVGCGRQDGFRFLRRPEAVERSRATIS